MYRTFTLFSLMLLSMGLAFADKPKAEPAKNVAAVTSYVPAVGDVLQVEFINEESKHLRQEITIAHIATDQTVTLQVSAFEIVANGDDNLLGRLEAMWQPKKDFLAELPPNNHTVAWKTLTIGNKRIACCVVTIGTTSEFWVAADRGSRLSVPPGPSTQFPGLLLFKEGGKVLYELKSITQSKSKSSSSGK